MWFKRSVTVKPWQDDDLAVAEEQTAPWSGMPTDVTQVKRSMRCNGSIQFSYTVPSGTFNDTVDVMLFGETTEGLAMYGLSKSANEYFVFLLDRISKPTTLSGEAISDLPKFLFHARMAPPAAFYND